MRIVDPIIQTLLVLAALFISVVFPQNAKNLMDHWLTTLGLLAAWQFISCIITLVSRYPFLTMRKIYISAFPLCIFLFAVEAGLFRSPVDVNETFPQVFAISMTAFYYLITFFTAFNTRRSKGKFLPHTNF
jgi:hypothetical protein